MMAAMTVNAVFYGKFWAHTILPGQVDPKILIKSYRAFVQLLKHQ